MILNMMRRASLTEKGCLNTDLRECAMQVTGKSVPSGEGRQCKGPGVSPAGPPGNQSGWSRMSNREVMWGAEGIIF